MPKSRRVKNKYHNLKVTIDGIKFDSKKESERYVFLKQKEALGQIENLQCHVTFPVRYDGALLFRYIADFMYDKDGESVVEDVKGSAWTVTPVFKLKKRILAAMMNVHVREIFDPEASL